MFTKLRLYLKESFMEFKRVNWPSRKEAAVLVGVVVFVSLAVAIYLGALDFGFVYLLKQLLT
ncbi:MAG: preprotein translocase subunit SecE [Candidatus Colwellbacteria bacterium RBG_13_48_8]|uniref:Protein translocase subunit SecE n=1 Tax=Candidatus Colwellbacteria bacterium RBG_13_48_8 TaxID=1797685 RepID=A0A1G1YZT8_9BACT|nr:MAG: preprotein translocase subunit SecE [Candidatus Colwellbacteria bacterium RBG_13_48_8]